jgi:Domain of unknown function (DUF4412)
MTSAMKPTLTPRALLLLASCACLAGCGLFEPKGSAPDAGAAATPPSSVPAVHGLSFVSSQQPFEGEIAMTLTRPGKPQAVAYYDIKGLKVRIRTTPPEGDTTYVLADTSTWDVASVSDSKKTMTQLNLDTTFAGVPKKKATRADRVEVVAGYECDVYRVDEDGGDKTEACMARGLRFPALDPAYQPWLSGLGAESFPMRVVVVDSAGTPKSRMEVTSVQKTDLPDTLFAVPSGYRSVDVAALVKGDRDH